MNNHVTLSDRSLSKVTLGEFERSLREDGLSRRVVIPGVLPVGPCLLYGPSGAGKTGLAVRTAIAVAGGLDWADRGVWTGSVLYVAGEDLYGAKLHLVAAAQELGKPPAELPIAIMESPADGLVTNAARLAVAVEAQALAKQTGVPVALIIVDTLAASFGPKSQDDASAASEYMSNAYRTARDLECAVLSIHHTGKNENSGMRGSRVFFDRAEAVIKVSRGRTNTSFVKVEKMRNGPSGARFAYEIAGRDVPVNGGSIDTQVIRNLRAIEPTAISFEDGVARQKETIANQMLGTLVRIGGVHGAAVSAWQIACYELWPTKNPEQKRKLFSNTKRRMQGESLIGINGDIVTVIASGDAMMTALVTPQPEDVTVTVTVTNPLSIEGGAGTDGRANWETTLSSWAMAKAPPRTRTCQRRSERRMPFVGGMGVKPPISLRAPVTVTMTRQPQVRGLAMQRDLFKADVVAFPLARTVEVSRMVRFLGEVRTLRAQAYYTNRCQQLAKRLKDVGLHDQDVRREIIAFDQAVQRALSTRRGRAPKAKWSAAPKS